MRSIGGPGLAGDERGAIVATKFHQSPIIARIADREAKSIAVIPKEFGLAPVDFDTREFCTHETIRKAGLLQFPEVPDRDWNRCDRSQR